MVQAIDNLELFNIDINFTNYNNSNWIKIVDKKGIKFIFEFNVNKNDVINIIIKGNCDGAKGFRIYTNNNEGKKSCDYYYTGKIEKGEFKMNIKFEVNDISNELIILRPLSTINIDNIAINYLKIIYGEINQELNLNEDGILI